MIPHIKEASSLGVQKMWWPGAKVFMLKQLEKMSGYQRENMVQEKSQHQKEDREA